MTLRKTYAALGALLSLSACNMVVSEQPWFDAASGPQLKDGLWVNLQSPDCKFDPAGSIADWPKCADPMLVQGNVYSGPPSSNDDPESAKRLDPSKWVEMQHVLVDGVPQIDQILLPLPPSGDAPPAGMPKEIYLYLAVGAQARDSEGRIIETRRWPILCGPMPAKPKKGANGMPQLMTDRPYKGIRIERDMCLAEDVAALRNAAAQSEAAAGEAGFTKVTSRWVRDSL
jgi:hypothetical protein